MPAARDWEVTIRAVASYALSQRGCRRGWTVLNHRGHARLNIAAGAGRGRRRQVLLPIPWEWDPIDQIRDAVQGTSQGSINSRPISAKSATSLVASGTPGASAVAAITASAVAMGRASNSRRNSSSPYQ